MGQSTRSSTTFLPLLALISAIAVLSSATAVATISITNGTVGSSGASNVTAPPVTPTQPGASPAPVPQFATPTFYYSNISLTTDGLTPASYLDANGGPCATSLNPNCRQSTSPFCLTFVNTTPIQNGVTPTMHLVYSATAPATGQQISTFKEITAAVPYTPNVYTAFAGAPVNNVCTTSGMSFGTVCTAVNAANNAAGIDGLCHVPAATNTPVVIPLYLIADTTGGGTVGTDILQFNLNILSTIQTNAVVNSAGLYGYYTFPGDAKVHLKAPPGDTQLVADATFPQENGGISGLAEFIVPDPAGGTSPPFNAANFALIDPTTWNTPAGVNAGVVRKTAAVKTDGTLDSYYITDLNNGTRYYFRFALIDNAGNMGYWTTTPPADFDLDIHSAIPDQVVGLLSESGHCFVATAAFGSPMAEQVQTLRDFRDKFLMKSKWGRNFISWYYDHSPYWAERIEHHDNVRAVVRGFLYPVIGYSWVALRIGAYNASLLTATLLLLPLLILRLRKQHPRKRLAA